jgi:hypothetical protein
MATVHQGGAPANGSVVVPACVAALSPRADAPAVTLPPCQCGDCPDCDDREAAANWEAIAGVTSGWPEFPDPEVDGFTWELGPDPDDAAERLSGHEVVAMEAERYRTLGTPIADLIAATLEDLAQEWRFLGGQSVGQFLDRRLQMELWYCRREAEAEMQRGAVW